MIYGQLHTHKESVMCHSYASGSFKRGKQILINCFLKCCISNALDGSQDNKIWKDDWMNQSDDNMDK